MGAAAGGGCLTLVTAFSREQVCVQGGGEGHGPGRPGCRLRAPRPAAGAAGVRAAPAPGTRAAGVGAAGRPGRPLLPGGVSLGAWLEGRAVGTPAVLSAVPPALPATPGTCRPTCATPCCPSSGRRAGSLPPMRLPTSPSCSGHGVSRLRRGPEGPSCCWPQPPCPTRSGGRCWLSPCLPAGRVVNSPAQAPAEEEALGSTRLPAQFRKASAINAGLLVATSYLLVLVWEWASGSGWSDGSG